jgi:hypothetical protein
MMMMMMTMMMMMMVMTMMFLLDRFHSCDQHNHLGTRAKSSCIIAAFRLC